MNWLDRKWQLRHSIVVESNLANQLDLEKPSFLRSGGFFFAVILYCSLNLSETALDVNCLFVVLHRKRACLHLYI